MKQLVTSMIALTVLVVGSVFTVPSAAHAQGKKAVPHKAAVKRAHAIKVARANAAHKAKRNTKRAHKAVKVKRVAHKTHKK